MKVPYYPWALKSLLDGRPSIGSLMDLCDENYHHLSRLAPTLREMRGRYLSETICSVALYLEILEQTPYTTLIHLTYYFFDGSEQKADPDATLRIYHDSRQAEVINLKQRALPLDRTFESPALDQKWKINMFISKWLSYCAGQGHSFAPLGADGALNHPVLEQA
ncbi:MAG: DUF1249 domain-containing protein [Sedimenticola sp.]